MNCLIEFDGIQHERPSEKFGGTEKLVLQQYHDGIKDDFCKEITEVPLIRAKHNEIDKIESILGNKLNKFYFNYKKIYT